MDKELDDREYIKFSQKEVGQIVAALLIGFFFVFITGYFIGKRKTLEELAIKQEDEVFADKMIDSLATIYEEFEKKPNSAKVEQSDLKEVRELDKSETNKVLSVSVKPISPQSNKAIEIKKKLNKPVKQELAFAELCGFGLKKNAVNYSNRLKKRGINTTVLDRKSRSKKGKTITWYQVITDSMEIEKLKRMVKDIKKKDKLSGVNIVKLKS